MNIRRIAGMLALGLMAAAGAVAHDGARGYDGYRGDRGIWRSGDYGWRDRGRYRAPVVVQPRVIVVPRYRPVYGPAYGYGHAPYGYVPHGYGAHPRAHPRYHPGYRPAGYGWPGYVHSHPRGSFSLTLSLPLR
jgi:hypothetical protein